MLKISKLYQPIKCFFSIIRVYTQITEKNSLTISTSTYSGSSTGSSSMFNEELALILNTCETADIKF